ncbi:MAG TPA: hypothetical protein VMA09_14925 [Candidatus Binataceae bacterium]|nr:hypothetical protein [Candidatus Binataceae bacterium]
MEDRKQCERRRLAGENSFTVESCECGAIHLTIGFLTLRMEPCAYREFARIIAGALNELDPTISLTIH